MRGSDHEWQQKNDLEDIMMSLTLSLFSTKALFPTREAKKKRFTNLMS